MKIYNVYKQVGATPLETLLRLRDKKKIPATKSLSYAGRLDPMAEGVLLILQDANQKQREKYLGLDKVYRVKVLLGFSTDSFDLLGLPKKGNPKPLDLSFKLPIKAGILRLPLPRFSSVIHQGKPLFTWARAGKIKNKDLPIREMQIKYIKLLGKASVSAGQIQSYIKQTIPKITGDFRQKNILRAYQKILAQPKQRYDILDIYITCASGTYIRSIAQEIGVRLKMGGVVYKLTRLRVGKYTLKAALKL